VIVGQIPPERPSYEKGLMSRNSYTSVAKKEGNNDGYKIVEGSKRFTKPKGITLEPISSIRIRE